MTLLKSVDCAHVFLREVYRRQHVCMGLARQVLSEVRNLGTFLTWVKESKKGRKKAGTKEGLIMSDHLQKKWRRKEKNEKGVSRLYPPVTGSIVTQVFYEHTCCLFALCLTGFAPGRLIFFHLPPRRFARSYWGSWHRY